MEGVEKSRVLVAFLSVSVYEVTRVKYETTMREEGERRGEARAR